MPADDKEAPEGEGLVAVRKCSAAEAQVVVAILRNNGVRAIISPAVGRSLMPPVAPTAFSVMVLQSEVKRAKRIIDESLASAAAAERIRVLFVCTHNRFRSQMAEGFLRSLGGEKFEAFSAGTNPQGPSPAAINIMKEAGVDISRQTASHVDEFLDEQLDYVITVCDDANESCPVFPAVCERQHWSFADPSKFTGSPEEIEKKMRNVRDQIRTRVLDFIAAAKKRR
jgi:arsenate reductase